MVLVLVVVVGKVMWWFVVLKQECYVAQANLDLAIQGDFRFWIFSPQPPACWDEHSPSRWDDGHVLLHTVLHAVTGMYFYTQFCRIRLQACATTYSPVCWGDRHVLLHTVSVFTEKNTNVPKSVLTVRAQPFEWTEKHWIICFKWVNYGDLSSIEHISHVPYSIGYSYGALKWMMSFREHF